MMYDFEKIVADVKYFEKTLTKAGGNFQAFISFEKVCGGTDIAVAKEKIDEKLPLFVKQRKDEVISIKHDVFVQSFIECLLFRGDRGAGVFMKEKQEVEFRNKLQAFKKMIKRNFNPFTSDVYIYSPLAFGIFWGFGFLIVSKTENAIYAFSGGADD